MLKRLDIAINTKEKESNKLVGYQTHVTDFFDEVLSIEVMSSFKIQTISFLTHNSIGYVF